MSTKYHYISTEFELLILQTSEVNNRGYVSIHFFLEDDDRLQTWFNSVSLDKEEWWLERNDTIESYCPITQKNCECLMLKQVKL